MTEPEQEEMYAAVGRCLAAWSSLERGLTELFLALHDQMPLPDVLLRYTFECVQSFEVRLSMVNATVVNDKRNIGVFAEKWNALHNKISRGARRRAQVAHFTIIKHNEFKPPVWKLHPFLTTSRFFALSTLAPTPNALRLDQLCARQESFIRLARRLRRFAEYVHAIRGTFGTSPQPATDLAHLLDTEPAPTPKASA